MELIGSKLGLFYNRKGRHFMGLAVLSKINVNQLKVFEAVYRHKSMTLAAQELFLTQSGVSQHMKAFEESTGLTLFIRSRNMLYTTEEADKLYEACIQAFTQIAGVLTQIKDPIQNQITGTIKIGMPTEFGNNILIPYLADWATKYSLVKLDFIYGYGQSLMQQLEDGEIDIAFIDSIQKNKKIASKIVFEEKLSLVVSPEYFKNKSATNQATFKISSKESLKDLLSLDFLEFEHKESILRTWFQYHYNKKNVGLNVKAWAMNVQGVANLIKQGLGAGVLTDHVIEMLKQQGHSLYIFKGKKESMKNSISAAWVKDKPRSQAQKALLKHITEKFFLIQETSTKSARQ